MRPKTVIEDKIIEQINSFVYLGYDVSCLENILDNRIIKFQRTNGIISRNLQK
jgi:hypothetical protein